MPDAIAPADPSEGLRRERGPGQPALAGARRLRKAPARYDEEIIVDSRTHLMPSNQFSDPYHTVLALISRSTLHDAPTIRGSQSPQQWASAKCGALQLPVDHAEPALSESDTGSTAAAALHCKIIELK